jgi:hypothetical protein
MKKLLALSYKGTRDYLHGTDFFSALADSSPEATGQPDAFVDRLIFRRFARHACEVTTDQPADLAAIVGQVRFRSPHEPVTLDAWLVETDVIVTARRPFDEELLLADAHLDISCRSAQLPAHSIYTTIEEVIALTKQLNYAISPEVAGKWVFGQLDLIEPLADNYNVLTVQMTKLIAGRFSVNEIYIDERRIGSIRFIVGTP